MKAALQPRPPQDVPHPGGWPRALAGAVLLAALCALLQALLPAYTLGAEPLLLLNLTLGVMVAAAWTRGPGALLGAALGAALGGFIAQRLGTAGAGSAFTGLAAPWWTPGLVLVKVGWLLLQAALAAWLLRRAADPGLSQLDSAPRLRRLVLLAAPAAALLGALGTLLLGALQADAPGETFGRAALAHALGRWVVDWAGIVIVCAVLLCWLARPIAPWWPRRRLVAWPLLLALAVLLPGLDQVARRDDRRLEVRFEQEAVARQRHLQQLLVQPQAALSAARGLLAAGGPALADKLFDSQAQGWAAQVAGLRALGWLSLPGGVTGTPVLGHARPLSPALTERVRQAAQRALAGDPAVVLRLGPDEWPPAGAAAVLPAETTSAAPAMLLLQRVPGDGPTAPRLAFAVVDLQRQLQPALPEPDDLNLRVCVYDHAPATLPRQALDAGPASAAAPLAVLAGPPSCARAPAAGAFRTHGARLALAERPLALLSVEPPTADNRLFTSVWLLGLPSVLGLGLLATLLLAITGRIRRIEDRVQERTAALQAEVEERARAQRALVHSEQRFRAIFDSVNIGVTLVDAEGRLQMVNPAFCALLGYPAEALVGRPLADFKLPDVAEDDGTAEALGGHHARRQRYLSADGRVLQVAASLTPLHDPNDPQDPYAAPGPADPGRPPIATVGALHDLTPVLRLREAERARDEADVANRTKSDFLARLGHELRAPLSAIVAFAEMVEGAEAGRDASLREHRTLARIRQAGWHVLDMVNDVLDLSRLEAGTLHLSLGPVRLGEVAQEALDMLEPAANRAGVMVELSLAPEAEWAQADALRVRQVLVNLVGNAVKYNRPGGRVWLRTRPAGVGELALQVQDTGPGIAPEQIEALFRPFHRLGRARDSVPGALHEQGTGIGLVICRKLAALMGGRLEVSSAVGEGSMFSLILPRAVGLPAQAPPGAVPRPSSAPPGLAGVATPSIGQVLYIEDNPADVAQMRQLLAARPGITLTVAGTAEEGLALSREADLVLLDLDLSDRPGLELLLVLRQDTRMQRLPVIVVSAETRPERIDTCIDAGASAFFSKPLEAASLLRAIDNALQQL